MLKIALISASGDEYDLTGTQSTSPVLAPEEALTALVGSASRTDVVVPGRSGVIPGRRKFGAIQVDIPFFLHADSGEQMERVYRKFRRGWSDTVPSVFRVDADHPLGVFYLDVVRGSELPGVAVDMRRRTSTTLTVNVFSARGLFRSKLRTGTGTVTVTNHGDDVVHPRIRYSGAGGSVTSPSQATFTLPTVEKETVIDLDPRKLRLDGAFGEGIPAKGSGVWILPAGATLEWELLISDPWA